MPRSFGVIFGAHHKRRDIIIFNFAGFVCMYVCVCVCVNARFE